MKKEIKNLLVSIFATLLAFAANAFSVQAQTFTLSQHSFAASTYLLDIRQESHLTQKARALREGGFETADGNLVTFYSWYAPDTPELQITWLTQVNKNFGVIWGFGTGEFAQKYTIDPSLHIGFTFQSEFRKRNFFTLTANTVIGGEFKEKTCVADYGEIGGIREVNCRLAATTLSPEETLQFLESGKPTTSVQVGYKYLF